MTNTDALFTALRNAEAALSDAQEFAATDDVRRALKRISDEVYGLGLSLG